MAAPTSMRFIPYAPPPSNRLPSNGNTIWPTQVGRSNMSVTSSQKIRKPTAILSRSGGQSGAERNVAARVEGWEHDNETDDDLPSLEELLRTGPRQTTSAGNDSRAEPNSQHLDQPVLNGAGTQANRMKSGISERQGDSLDQPMILDDESEEESIEDKAEDSASDIETGHPKRVASPQSTLETSDLASRPTKSIDTSGPWYDVEEGRYIDGLSMLVEPAPHSSNPLLNGNDGWTDNSIAELEKAVEMALVEEVNPSSTSTLSSPRPHAVNAPHDKIENRQCTETSGSRPEGLRDASRRGNPAQGLEECEQRDTQVVAKTQAWRELQEGGLVAEGGQMEMQQQGDIRDSQIHPSSQAQPEVNPKHLAATINNGHCYNLLRSASPSGSSSPVLCDKTDLGNVGEKRGRKDTYPISSKSQYSVNSDDTCDIGDEDSRPTKRRKPCTAPTLITPLHVRNSRFSVPPLTATSLEIEGTQPQADNGCPSKLVDNEQQYTSHSRNPFMAIEDCFSREDEELDELAMDDYSQQGNDTDGSDNSADEDYGHDTSNEDDEDFRPAKRSKLSSPPHTRHSSLCIPAERGNVRSKCSRHPPSQASEHVRSLPSSQSLPPSAEPIPLAEYREYNVRGVFKSTRFGNDTTFYLELRMAGFPEHLRAPLNTMSSTLATKISSSPRMPSRRHARSTQHCKTRPQRKHVESSPQHHTTQRPITSSKAHHQEAPPTRRTRWTEAEEDTVIDMRKRGTSWKEISIAVPSHPLGSITGHYYSTLCKRI